MCADGHVLVCFHPHQVELGHRRAPALYALAVQLGPDILAPVLDIDSILARARTFLPAHPPLGDVLLDHRVAAGIGNVYKSELLFLMRLSPLQTLAHTQDETLRALHFEAVRLLRANMRPGRRRTRQGALTAGDLWVYGRKDQPCHRCGEDIRQARLGKHLRSTYCYPQCQAAAGDHTVADPSRFRTSPSRPALARDAQRDFNFSLFVPIMIYESRSPSTFL